MESIKVVVRCRPLNSREIARGSQGLIRMEGQNTYLSPPENSKSKEVKSFAFDKSYWSAGAKDEPDYASQQNLYDDLGKDLLDHSFNGYNTCIFAYGQTGSGKSYSMMGYGQDKGIIPLICEALFDRVETLTSEKLSFTVEVSYQEIYQEKVRDLLNPGNKGHLKVREHPARGPYVEGLSRLAVRNYAEVESLMEEGTKARTVAATNMNETSSRSHAVFTLLLTQKRLDVEVGISGEKISRISLVDLAGSERANATGATGQRLKEGALINKSLTTLGRVISALAASSSGKVEKVPYRDSVLTWLLKDSLGGNSKTAMIAAISPADYEETLSTLRYADQAKKIKNKAVVNEDSNTKLIRELKEELATLRTRMSTETYDSSLPPEQQLVQFVTKSGELRTVTRLKLQEELEASENLMAEVTQTWEEKLIKTQEIALEREAALEALGITMEKDLMGVHASKKNPNLVNLNEDPLMSECLIYQIKRGSTVVGNSSHGTSSIRLSGSSILPEHAHFEFSDDDIVTLHPRGSGITMVNGLRISEPKVLKSGFRIIMGDFHVFRFNHPEEVRKAREGGILGREATSSPYSRAESPALLDNSNVDWAYARREVLQLNGTELELDKLRNEDLDKLFTDVLRVRHARNPSNFSSSDRAESRMSYLDSVTEDGDEMDSDSPRRPFSGGTWSTAETSLGDSPGPSLGDALNARDIDEQLRAVREEYDEKKKLSNEEKEVLETKLKSLESALIAEKKKRYSSGDKKVKAIPLTVQEIRLARVVVERWRSLRRVRMAEDVLSIAVLLKEANVIACRELKKAVIYQFIIVDGRISNSSCYKIPSNFDIDIENSDLELHSSRFPTVAIKVIDFQHTLVSVWSIPEFKLRLEKMRSLSNFKESMEHFAIDPFYSPAPESGHSLVGVATFSLSPISRYLPSTFPATISSILMIESLGTCRVRVKPVSIVAPNQSPTGNGSHPSLSRFVEGSILEFEIIVDRVTGFDKSEFASLHLQLNTLSLFGSSITEEETFTSEPIDLHLDSSNQIKFKQKITVELTTAVQYHLSNHYGRIEFFTIVKPSHLERIQASDRVEEAPVRAREPDNKLVIEQNHDLIATVNILELETTGFLAVPVISLNSKTDSAGAFFIRQGIQRRLTLDLSHNSGKGWKFKIGKVKLGSIRLLDGQGRIHSDPSTVGEVGLIATKKSKAIFEEGTGKLSFSAAWDSSRHDSLLLDRITKPGERILIGLKWEVESDNSNPVLFEMDIAVTVQARDDRIPSKWLNLLTSTRISNSITSIFSVRLIPTNSTLSSNLWTLSTAEVFVRGEELLGDWKPRGLSLIRDFEKRKEKERKLVEVESIKAVLAAFELTLPSAVEGIEPVERLGQVIELWKKSWGKQTEINLYQRTAPLSLSTRSPSLPLESKLTGFVSLIPRTESFVKKGQLILLRDPSAASQKFTFYCIIKRPYLYLYESSTQTDLSQIINLSTAKIEETSPEIEEMLGLPHVFALYTRQNSYFFQAISAKEVMDWIRAMS